MNFEELHFKELEWIKSIQESLRTPFLDSIMLCLNLADTFPFYVLFITLIWFSYKRDLGIKLIFLFFITSFINQEAKELLSQPRPCQMDLAVCMIKAKSFGIPSGAAQSMVTLFGYLCYTIRNKFFWLFSLCFVFLISFSRIYLGLHFFSDIALGWTLGLIITGSYIIALPYLENYIKKQVRSTLTIHACLLTAFLSLLILNKNSSLVVFSSFGVMLGLIYSKPITDPKKTLYRLERPFIVVLGVFALLMATLFLPEKASLINMIVNRLLQILAGIWIACLASPVIKKVEKVLARLT
jgi:membrane-associated phospholipid phosphatase